MDKLSYYFYGPQFNAGIIANQACPKTAWKYIVEGLTI